MQEEQTVTFSPMGLIGNPSWHEKLLAFYMLAMIILLAVRIVRFAWNLRQLYKLLKEDAHQSGTYLLLWAECLAKASSLKNFAVLTFLLSAVEVIWSTSDISSNFALGLFTGWKGYLMAISAALIDFKAGLIICTALFVSAMLMQHLLNRRKPESETKASVPSP